MHGSLQRHTLPLDHMTTLVTGSDPADLAETHIYTRRRWLDLHREARRIAELQQRRQGQEFPLPPLPAALLAAAHLTTPPAPNGYMIMGRYWPKRWLAITAVVLWLDVLLVMASLLWRGAA